MPPVNRAAVVGGGVIGAGWAARLAQNGIRIRVFDPDPEAPRKLCEVLENAERAIGMLMHGAIPPRAEVLFVESLEEAVTDAELIVESVPERTELKREVHARIEAAMPQCAIATSSTSGLRPTEIQRGMKNGNRLLVAHPFNPVYLLPLVELCGGEKTDPCAISRAREIFTAVGMRPLTVRKEIDGFLADRLMEALWREALWLIHDDIATTEEIDDAVRFGAGLRWAMMGTFQTFWLAGGEGGMRAMLAQFGPCLKWPWTHLMEAPELSEPLIEKIATQCDTQAGKRSPRELERVRDEGLVGILTALEEMNWGAGEATANYRKLLQPNIRSART